MASQYSTQVKAEVIEMSRQGVTTPQIAQKLDVPRRTLSDWLKAARDLALAEDRDPRLVDGEYRLAYMGQQIQEAQLEELAAKIDAGESVLNYIIPVNALKGTSIDKVAKQPTTIQAQNIQINFISQKAPVE
jgi:transposase-like protein